MVQSAKGRAEGLLRVGVVGVGDFDELRIAPLTPCSAAVSAIVPEMIPEEELICNPVGRPVAA